MIEYRDGDLLADRSEALVNAVNCVGVMGAGVALAFRRRFPENFRAYAAACRRNEVAPGRMFVFETGAESPPRYLVNFPTKRHWRDASRMEDIVAGLQSLREEVRARAIGSVALPALGCGLGGLPWPEVRAVIAEGLRGLEGARVTVYRPREPPSAAAARGCRARKPPNRSPGQAARIHGARRPRPPSRRAALRGGVTSGGLRGRPTFRRRCG